MRDTSNELTTKEKIIKSTLDIIAMEGFQKVTIRKIAMACGVNVAAVNYHFGSKDQVISRALQYVTSQIITVFDNLKDRSLGPQQRLEKFTEAYTECISRYPDILKHFINQEIHNASSPTDYGEYLRAEGIELLKSTIKEARPDDEEAILYMRTLQLFGGLAFPTLMSDKIKEITDLEVYSSPEQRAAYSKLLADCILEVRQD